MSTYSVAAAKAALPRLINEALAGEDVLITRHGKPVARLRPADVPDRDAARAAHEQLLAGRLRLPAGSPTSVELLDLIYDHPDG